MIDYQILYIYILITSNHTAPRDLPKTLHAEATQVADDKVQRLEFRGRDGRDGGSRVGPPKSFDPTGLTPLQDHTTSNKKSLDILGMVVTLSAAFGVPALVMALGWWTACASPFSGKVSALRREESRAKMAHVDKNPKSGSPMSTTPRTKTHTWSNILDRFGVRPSQTHVDPCGPDHGPSH